MKNQLSYTEQLFNLYNDYRNAQDNLPSRHLVDSTYEYVLAGIENEPSNYDVRLFIRLCNDQDAIVHPSDSH